MKSKRFLIILFLIFSLLISVTVAYAATNITEKLSAKSAVLYEPQNKTVIFGKNERLRAPMASTTKVMTAILALENCEESDDVVITKDSVGIEGSSVYLKENQVVTVKDLLYCVLLQSANDASSALAIHISGSISAFSELMNKKAESLGLTDTHYENPHGLDADGHYTTALDLAILSSYALKNPKFKEITSTYKYSFEIEGSPRCLVNHNKMLKRYEGCNGVKTGYTKKSGRCLVSAAERDGLELVCVTLCAPDDWNDHTTLLNLGFETYEAVRLVDITDTSFDLSLINSPKNSCTVSIQNSPDDVLIKRKSSPYFKAEIHLPHYLVAPLQKGDKVGEIIITQDGREIKRYDITCTTDIEQKNKSRNFLWF